MTKHVKLILVLVAAFLVVSVGAASAATFSFYNTDHRKTASVRLLWVDHNFKKIGPVTVAVGTVHPEDLWVVEYEYSGKIWEVVWNSDEFGRGQEHKLYFHIFDNVESVIVFPHRIRQFDKGWNLVTE